MNKPIVNAITILSALLLSSPLAAQEEFFSESGEFSADGNTSTNRHVIPVEAGMRIEVIVIGSGVDTMVNATMPDGTSIQNDDYQELNAGFMRTISSDGEVQVTASPLSSGTTGSYRVVARTLPPPETISVGETVTGHLSDSSGSGDFYELSGSAGTRVAIDLKSYDFDAFLTVVDNAGNEKTDDDGGAQGYNSRLHHEFDADGTIMITAGSLASSTGQYELSVTELSTEAAAEISGSLSTNSQRGYDGSRFERHEFEGQAGETITVQLDSAAFDAVVYVSNPDGSNLAQDDDGGDGNNSLAIVTLPETGTYSVYVSSFGNSTGDYQLTIYR